LVSFALLVTTVSFRNQSVIAAVVEQEIEGVRGGSCCGLFILDANLEILYFGFCCC
jgi:hypothetical protein